MKRCYRSRVDRKIAGVCGGLGEYFGVDPVLIRIVYVALIFIGGVGILTYFMMWFIIPLKPIENPKSE